MSFTKMSPASPPMAARPRFPPAEAPPAPTTTVDLGLKIFPPVFLQHRGPVFGSVIDQATERTLAQFSTQDAPTEVRVNDLEETTSSSSTCPSASSTSTRSGSVSGSREEEHDKDRESNVLKIVLQQQDASTGSLVLYSSLYLPVATILRNAQGSGQNFLTLWLGIENDDEDDGVPMQRLGGRCTSSPTSSASAAHRAVSLLSPAERFHNSIQNALRLTFPKLCVSIKLYNVRNSTSAAVSPSSAAAASSSREERDLLFPVVDRYDLALYSLYANCEMVLRSSATHSLDVTESVHQLREQQEERERQLRSAQQVAERERLKSRGQERQLKALQKQVADAESRYRECSEQLQQQKRCQSLGRLVASTAAAAGGSTGGGGGGGTTISMSMSTSTRRRGPSMSSSASRLRRAESVLSTLPDAWGSPASSAACEDVEDQHTSEARQHDDHAVPLRRPSSTSGKDRRAGPGGATTPPHSPLEEELVRVQTENAGLLQKLSASTSARYRLERQLKDMKQTEEKLTKKLEQLEEKRKRELDLHTYSLRKLRDDVGRKQKEIDALKAAPRVVGDEPAAEPEAGHGHLLLESPPMAAEQIMEEMLVPHGDAGAPAQHSHHRQQADRRTSSSYFDNHGITQGAKKLLAQSSRTTTPHMRKTSPGSRIPRPKSGSLVAGSSGAAHPDHAFKNRFSPASGGTLSSPSPTVDAYLGSGHLQRSSEGDYLYRRPIVASTTKVVAPTGGGHAHAASNGDIDNANVLGLQQHDQQDHHLYRPSPPTPTTDRRPLLQHQGQLEQQQRYRWSDVLGGVSVDRASPATAKLGRCSGVPMSPLLMIEKPASRPPEPSELMDEEDERDLQEVEGEEEALRVENDAQLEINGKDVMLDVAGNYREVAEADADARDVSMQEDFSSPEQAEQKNCGGGRRRGDDEASSRSPVILFEEVTGNTNDRTSSRGKEISGVLLGGYSFPPAKSWRTSSSSCATTARPQYQYKNDAHAAAAGLHVTATRSSPSLFSGTASTTAPSCSSGTQTIVLHNTLVYSPSRQKLLSPPLLPPLGPLVGSPFTTTSTASGFYGQQGALRPLAAANAPPDAATKLTTALSPISFFQRARSLPRGPTARSGVAQ